MDTVYTLIGKIGQGNLSANAKKKLNKLNELNENRDNLEQALKNADKKEEIMWQKKLDDAQKTLENFEEDFRVFLELELQDVEAKRQAQKDKADALKKQQQNNQQQNNQQQNNQDPKKKNGNVLAIVGAVVLAGVLGVGATAFLKNK